MSYINEAREAVLKELARLPNAQQHCPPELLDLYALLALTLGESVMADDVHDAWAVWQSRREPDHQDLIPFAELSVRTQELDRPYVEAIKAAALVIRK